MIFDLKRLVRVSNQEENKGGTGYLLGPDRVLTARHVLKKLDSPVVWFNDQRGKKVRATLDGKPWVGPDAVDIAVLPIQTDLRLEPQRLSGKPLEEVEPWVSKGWAVAGSSLGGSSLVSSSMTWLSGTAYPFLETEKTLQLTVNGPPSDERWWKGASGAPVFCGTRLVGVVRGGEECFKGERLYATPIALAWNLQGFQTSVGYGEDYETLRQSRGELLIKDLASILLRSEKAARILTEEQPGWKQALDDGAGGVTLLAKAMGETPWREALGAFARAHARVHKERPHQDWGEVEHVLVEALGRVLPAVYGSMELEVVAGYEGGQLIHLPFESRTVVELAMAAQDGRRFHFERLTSLQQEALGRGLIDMDARHKEGAPSHGIDFRNESGFNAWVVRLAEECLPSGDLRLAREERFEELAQLVNSQLEREVRNEEPRRYLVYSRKFAVDHAEFLAQVGEKLKALHRVELSGRGLVQERDETEPLLDILYRHSRERTPRS